MKKNKINGFTLIELIMVMIILGILSAVAIPRYLETIEKSEVASEDAIIDKICVALENHAQHKMLTKGRRIWPENPFTALVTVPQTYTDDLVAEISGEITHQRADNTRWQWTYIAGINHGTDGDVTGTLYRRSVLGTVGTVIRYQ